MIARVVVPMEPTKEMIDAGQCELDNCVDTSSSSDADGNMHDYTYILPDAPSQVYRAMLAAAPPYSPNEAEVEAIGKVLAGWYFPVDGSMPDKIRAALIAADRTRREGK